MQFSYNLTEEDYLLFNKYHLLNSDAGKKTLFTFRLVIPFFCLLFVFLFFVIKLEPMLILIETILMIIVSILWVIFSKKLMFVSLKKNIKRLSLSGKLPYSKEGVLVFDDKYIQDITPDSETKTKYSIIEKIAITENAIYIYFNSVQAYIVPTGIFSTEDEKQRTIQFINSKVGSLQNAQ